MASSSNKDIWNIKDNSTLDEELYILNKDYVKAFCKGGFPVYSDRLQAEGVKMEEDLLEHLYGLSIKDAVNRILVMDTHGN